MRNAFQTRILAVALAVATLGLCVLAGFNLSQDMIFESPTDGVWWVEAQGGLRAERVPADSPGSRAGIRQGDILQAIDDVPTPRVAPLEREMYTSGTWSHATYVATVCQLRDKAHALQSGGERRIVSISESNGHLLRS